MPALLWGYAGEAGARQESPPLLCWLRGRAWRRAPHLVNPRAEGHDDLSRSSESLGLLNCLPYSMRGHVDVRVNVSKQLGSSWFPIQIC